MDIQMPQMDGYETSRFIRQYTLSQHRIPIVAVTANAFLSEYDLKNSSYIDDVLYKPIQIDQLNNLIERYIVEPNAVTIPRQLSTFDRNQYLDFFAQNLSSGKAMIDQFIAESPKDFIELESVIKLHNPDAIYRKLHYLKGSYGYLGAQRILYLINYAMTSIKSNEKLSNDWLHQMRIENRVLMDELEKFRAAA